LFDTPERFNPSFTRPAYGSNVREGHSFQFSNAPYYVSGQNDGFVQKHWGYDFTTDLNVNMGVDLNGILHSTGDYSYMPGGVNRFMYPHDSGHLGQRDQWWSGERWRKERERERASQILPRSSKGVPISGRAFIFER
jgi:hypothetical protein